MKNLVGPKRRRSVIADNSYDDAIQIAFALDGSLDEETLDELL